MTRTYAPQSYTVRQSRTLYGCILAHKPFFLCGARFTVLLVRFAALLEDKTAYASKCVSPVHEPRGHRQEAIAYKIKCVVSCSQLTAQSSQLAKPGVLR